MNDKRTYREGFEDGWRSVRRGAGLIPMNGARAPIAGKSNYESGFAHGVESAQRPFRKDE